MSSAAPLLCALSYILRASALKVSFLPDAKNAFIVLSKNRQKTYNPYPLYHLRPENHHPIHTRFAANLDNHPVP